jgi:glycosyltransferase involved in cell wall biosynthesis
MSKNDTYLVSVVIPCYRQGQFLSEAIESCLAQTYRPLEIIVVNDGSDDQTASVAANYADKIKYIYRKNGGLCAARNTGIAAVTGQYIKFLDADDKLAPEQIRWQVDAIEGRSNVIAVTTVRTFNDGRPGRQVDFVPTFSALLPDLLRQPDSAPHAWMFPATIVRAVGAFALDVDIAEDWEFLCRVGKLRPQVVCDERVGGYYRLRSGSMSTNKPRMVTSVARQLVRLHQEFRKDFPEWFSSDLLAAEQRTYRRLLLAGATDVALKSELLNCIRELEGHVGRISLSRHFEAVRRLVGYAQAERIYAGCCRLRRLLRL